MLYVDLETYSELDIRKVSLDRYARHSSTRITLCAFAGDEGPVDAWEDSDPPVVLDMLQKRMRRETCIAWNVGFERNLTTHVWKIPGLKWLDAMVLSLYAGLPAGLKDCNRVPFFAHEAETSKESILINKFCKPQKDGSVRDRTTDPEDWERFKQYCKDDVHDTRLIHQWLGKRFAWPEREHRAWLIDQDVNDRGMPIDRSLTEQAWLEAQRLQTREQERLKTLTGLENPNSPAQLLRWLTERGYPYTSLGKELVKKALSEDPDTEAETDNDVDD